MRRSLLWIPIAIALSGLASEVFARPKSDVVVVENGDHVTCEIKVLEYGMLTVKTDDMGTLQIKWHHIARLTSTNFFLVKTKSGFLHYGRFEDSAEDGIVDGLFRFTRPLTGGFYWCPPVADGRLDLRALR